MNNRTLIGVGSGLAVAILVIAILVAGTRGTAQQAAPAGAASAPLIVVVDRGAILRQSAAGQDLIKQADELGKQLEGKYGEEEKKLRAEAEELQEQASVLSPEARQKRERELRERGEKFQKAAQEDQAAIRNGINKAYAELEKAAWPILNEIFKERGATIMLDKAAIVIGSVDVDVTAAVIERLDKALPSVKVTPSKPEENAPQPPAQ